MERHRTVILLSEHELVRVGLAQVIRHAGYTVVVAATHGQLRRTPSRNDTVVVDVDHSTGDVKSLLKETEAVHDGYVIALGSALRLAAGVDGATVAAIEPRSGERGLLAAVAHRPPAASPELRRKYALWTRVTPRQRDVLRWLAIGLDNATIGRRLRIGERAVKAHVTSLLTLFSLTNRTELALLAHHAGLRPPNA